LLRSGSLLILKTPEVYYATTNQATWKIYVTNRGTGTAHGVWVDDVLGSGLAFSSAIVDEATGWSVTSNLDHNGSAINGAYVAIADMLPGERREITFVADVVGCDDLTNDVTASWGCGGLDCETPVSDSSEVRIPAPLLVTTNNVTSPLDACGSPEGYVALRNAGQTTNYDLQATVTLPSGLSYVSGSTRWRLNGGPWSGPAGTYDPNPTTSPLAWTSTEMPALASLDPGDQIEIEYELASACAFEGGDVTVSTQ